MNLSQEEIRTIASQFVPSDLQPRCLIHWDTTLKKRGDAISLGQRQLFMPFDGYFVFIDLVPQANWGHPARCLLVRADCQEVQHLDVSFPPHIGTYPDSFRTLSLGLPDSLDASATSE